MGASTKRSVRFQQTSRRLPERFNWCNATETAPPQSWKQTLAHPLHSTSARSACKSVSSQLSFMPRTDGRLQPPRHLGSSHVNWLLDGPYELSVLAGSAPLSGNIVRTREIVKAGRWSRSIGDEGPTFQPGCACLSGNESASDAKGHVMSRKSMPLLLAAAFFAVVSSGCYSHRHRLGPPPPAYACDSYGCDGYDAYGGYSQCIDDGQYYTRRDQRRMRRYDRRFGHGGHGWSGSSINGMPVMAAYIVPMGMDGGFGGCSACPTCGNCDSCGGCVYCDEMPGMPCGPCDMGGCPIDGGYQTYESEQPSPSQVSPESGTGTPEGDWQQVPQAPQSFIEPSASRPIENRWLPATL